MRKAVLDLNMSLDGYIAGTNHESAGLHDWFFNSNELSDSVIIDELISTTGAIIMGKRTYDLGDQMNGFVHNPFRVPHFVLTHHAPERPANGSTEFVFVTNGLEDALSQAIQAAESREVVIMGGANIAQQFIRARLLDEIQLHIVPIILGNGIRLFDQLGEQPIKLEPMRVVEAPEITHMRYRVIR